MTKKESKLTEKAARFSDARQTQWEEAIPKYLREVEALNNESARSHRFSMLLQELLGIIPDFIENYSSGIEKFLKAKHKDRLLKGEADNLFGNIIIEFEANIPKKKSEAEEQLKRYTAILWSQESPDSRTPYLCIATDGVRFRAYTPINAIPKNVEVEPENVNLNLLEEADWTKLDPDEIFYWLDRYFLRKEILHPTSETIVRDFGVKSHAFQTTTRALLDLWQEIKNQNAFAVIYESWEKYLRIVYGSELPGEKLFIRHTYLATLAKLISWVRLSEKKELPDKDQIIRVLEGREFKRYGIENFIEEDFFSWPGREKAVKLGLEIVRGLFSLLQNYRLQELSEDVLKSLYQELVTPETRHDLGEFYTPDWLAHRIVRKLLDENPRGSILDPSCGSGTFLYLAIREKREKLRNTAETLNHILDSVSGVDIHPLAVIFAKTNYILALGELLKKRKGAITIPIHLADTIRLPEYEKQTISHVINGNLIEQLPGYQVEIDGCKIHIPELLLENSNKYDQAIELAKEFATRYKGNVLDHGTFQNYLSAHGFRGSKDDTLAQALFKIAETLKEFMDSDRDSIWAFVLKNIYKPLFLKQSFDFVVGNPPWIVYRNADSNYQEFLKPQIVGKYKLLKGRGELITHLEIATLFLLRTADLYLKAGGSIAFVLPKSIFKAEQHDTLRKRDFILSEDSKYNIFWRELWDCENVNPLFNVPACVLIADKREQSSEKQTSVGAIPGQILKGKLSTNNSSLLQAESHLQVENVQFSLHTRGKKRSFWAIGEATSEHFENYYKNKFAQGASIVPHSFWFVQLQESKLGFNPDLPPIETDQRAFDKAKTPWKVKFNGNIESNFLYSTFLSSDLLPFGYLDNRLVMLPLEVTESNYKIIQSYEARNRGIFHLAQWLENVEKIWRKGREKKDKSSAISYLNYRNKLISQNPDARFKVLYPDVIRIPVATIVKTDEIIVSKEEQKLIVNNFIADTGTYVFETDNLNEAYYLVSCLNSTELFDRLSSLLKRKQKNQPHVHKKLFDVAPIPQYNAKIPSHIQLANLGKNCSAKVARWLAKGGAGEIKSIGKLRGMVRVMLKDELGEIDELVKQILDKKY